MTAEPQASPPRALPFATKTQPWDHQLEAYWAVHDLKGALLYMGMGTGKTACALHLIQGRGHKVVLIVCPKSVIPAWKKQVDVHCDGSWRVELLTKGSTAKKTEQLIKALKDHERIGRGPILIVTNYESVWRKPMAQALGLIGVDLLILDEVHRIKSARGKASRFLSRLGKKIKHRLGLSGTPLAHSPLDAYGIFRTLDPSIFGWSNASFKARYAVYDTFAPFPKLVRYQNQEDFRERFHRITFRAERDVLDLPDVQHIEHSFELTPPAKRIYRELAREFVADLGEGTITAANALTRLLRLQQLTSGYAKLDDTDDRYEEVHTGKADLLHDILDSLGPEEPVTIFCKFKLDLANIHRVAGKLGYSSLELSGARHELEAWQAGEAQVLAVQIQAGGVGVDMTRAAYCIYYSLGFSLAEYEQSLARVHRPGQDRPVVYLHLIAESTVDRRVYKVLAERKDVIETILKGGLE